MSTPSQQLGDLAATGIRNDNEDTDDDLDAEMEDLESSRQILAEELSRVDFSSIGDSYDSEGGTATPGSHETIIKKSKIIPGPKKLKGKDVDDWAPLLTAEGRFPPNFSPMGRVGHSKQITERPTTEENVSPVKASSGSDKNNKKNKEPNYCLYGEYSPISRSLREDEGDIKKSSTKDNQKQNNKVKLLPSSIIKAQRKKHYDSLKPPPRGKESNKECDGKQKNCLEFH